MRIVVDKRPNSCNDCMFIDCKNFVHRCRLTDNDLDKCNEWGEWTRHSDGYIDENCPLVEFGEMLEEQKKADERFERLQRIAEDEFGVSVVKARGLDETSRKLKDSLKVELIIRGLRDRGAGKSDIEAEIEYRKKTMLVDDAKCWGYLTNELEAALAHWDMF